MLDQERFDIYIDSLSAELPEPLGALEQEALAAGVPIIRKATQSLLAFLLVKDQPKRILEIGTAVGFSALFMKGCQNHYDRKSRNASGRGEEKSGSL